MFIDDLYVQKKIQGGDIGEFERLFTRNYKALCQVAFKILKDMDTAEDIVQEFFYQFWKNRESISLRLSLNAYLYQSVRNNSLHYLGHMDIREKYSFEIKNDFKQQIFTETDEVGYAELNKVVEQTLCSLPERCSLVFRLNRFEGKKYREIADMLSISVKTVEADMGKALQMFRKSLKDYTNQVM